MATITSTVVTIPTITNLKSTTSRPISLKSTTSRHIITAGAPIITTHFPRLSVKVSLKIFGAAMVATAATAMLAGNAMAIEILLGGDDGSLAFVPSNFSIPAGEKIVFKNNAGFPHNVVFDEDEVPAGVDVSKISMSEEDLLNGAGDTYSVTLTEKGTYSFYCAPHQGAGMVGKVTVT